MRTRVMTIAAAGHTWDDRGIPKELPVEGGKQWQLGRHRWVVERTHTWFAGFGKLRIRFERRLDTHYAPAPACLFIDLFTIYR